MDRDTLQVICRNESETDLLGSLLGRAAEAGLVVALSGNLGAGKTRLVRAAAQGLDVAPQSVNSPTFVLIHEYEGRLPVYHFDTYRLRDTDEFLELGADEYLHSEGVCFIEWAERMVEALPGDRLQISITSLGESTRAMEFQALGPRAARVLDTLKVALSNASFGAT